jgi:hypothetical protein
MKKVEKHRWNVGQSIIEVIIATGIVALVMTAIVAAITVSVKNTAIANQRLQASKYAQEGIEFFRQQRNLLGWKVFADTIRDISQTNETVCLNTITTSLLVLPAESCQPDQYIDARKNFMRSAFLETEPRKDGSVDIVRVRVMVYWFEGNQNKSSQTMLEFKEYSTSDAPQTTLTNQATADAVSSDGSHTPDKAIDGDPSTFWSAGGSAPKWIHLDLKQPKSISTIRLTVSQSPAGATSHDVYAGPDWSGRVLVKSFNQTTQDGDQLVADFNPPLTNVQHVWVFSNPVGANPNPSWVSWYEIQAY